MDILFPIIVVSLFCYAVIFCLYAYGWYKLKRENNISNKNAILTDYLHKFSIIIPARNEANNISNTLKSILNNNYPKSHFQIILIDDFSEDDTAVIAQQLLAFNNSNHKVIKLKDYLYNEGETKAYKKKSIEIGIKEANHEIIITTDADCVVSENWLNNFNIYFNNNQNAKIAIAPVNFTPAKHKDWLYYFQSIDFMTMQGITAASFTLKIGNMCNGANLAYTRASFNQVDGFKGINHQASGDDMMLYNKISKKFPGSAIYIYSKQAIVNTPVQPTWSDFLNQRIRWASKNGKYNDIKLTIVLLIVYCFNLSLVLGSIYAIFNWTYIQYILLFWLIKIIVELLLILPVSKFYNKQQEIKHYIILQPLHAIYIVVAGFLGLFKNYKWKGRTVN